MRGEVAERGEETKASVDGDGRRKNGDFGETRVGGAGWQVMLRRERDEARGAGRGRTRLRSRVATSRCNTIFSTRSGLPSETKSLTRSWSGSGSRLGSSSRRIGPSSLLRSAASRPLSLNSP